MKAEDTVRLCPTTTFGWRINCDPKCHNNQAEISFKAGFKYALEGTVIKGGYESVKLVGIREVVEWIEKNALREKAILGDNRILLAADWQAFKKEKGL